jgi:tetratricopeptide (TPR) repeat protein
MSSPAFSAPICDELWRSLIAESVQSAPVDYEKVLATWRETESRCKGSGVYEIRLASTYATLGRYLDARNVLADGSIPPAYRDAAEATRLEIDFLSLLDAVPVDSSRLADWDKRVSSFIFEHEGHLEILAHLGHARILLRRYEEAVKPLEDYANASESPSAGVFRNLAIAYAYSERYEGALAALDEAYVRDKNVTNDELFMYASAMAYAAVGNLEAAKTTLTLILNKKPQLRSDPEFQRTVARAKQLSGGQLK